MHPATLPWPCCHRTRITRLAAAAAASRTFAALSALLRHGAHAPQARAAAASCQHCPVRAAAVVAAGTSAQVSQSFNLTLASRAVAAASAAEVHGVAANLPVVRLAPGARPLAMGGGPSQQQPFTSHGGASSSPSTRGGSAFVGTNASSLPVIRNPLLRQMSMQRMQAGGQRAAAAAAAAAAAVAEQGQARARGGGGLFGMGLTRSRTFRCVWL